MGKEHLSVKALLDVFEVREFASVVCGDGQNASLKWQQLSHDLPGQRFGVLSLGEPFDNQEVGASFGHSKDDALSFPADDTVHLPVAEAAAVCARRPFVYHLAVFDGYVPARDLPARMPKSVAAVSPQRAAVSAVKADVGIDGLHAGACLTPAFHVTLDLFWRPLLFSQQREDPFAHVQRERAYGAHAVLALVALLLRQLVVVPERTPVSGNLTVNSARMNIYALRYLFFAFSVLQ